MDTSGCANTVYLDNIRYEKRQEDINIEKLTGRRFKQMPLPSSGLDTVSQLYQDLSPNDFESCSGLSTEMKLMLLLRDRNFHNSIIKEIRVLIQESQIQVANMTNKIKSPSSSSGCGCGVGDNANCNCILPPHLPHEILDASSPEFASFLSLACSSHSHVCQARAQINEMCDGFIVEVNQKRLGLLQELDRMQVEKVAYLENNLSMLEQLLVQTQTIAASHPASMIPGSMNGFTTKALQQLQPLASTASTMKDGTMKDSLEFAAAVNTDMHISAYSGCGDAGESRSNSILRVNATENVNVLSFLDDRKEVCSRQHAKVPTKVPTCCCVSSISLASIVDHSINPTRPSNIQCSLIGVDQVKVTWSIVPTSQCSGVSGYLFYIKRCSDTVSHYTPPYSLYSDTNGFVEIGRKKSKRTIFVPGATYKGKYFVDMKGQEGNTLCFYVQSVDTVGRRSELSDVASSAGHTYTLDVKSPLSPTHAPSPFCAIIKIPYQVELEYKYNLFGDVGVFQWIGSKGGTDEYVNPQQSGEVVVSASSVAAMGCNLAAFVSKGVNRQGHLFTSNKDESWISVDLGHSRKMIVNDYILRHSGSDEGFKIQSWLLQARCNQDYEWVTIHHHAEDQDYMVDRSVGRKQSGIGPVRQVNSPSDHSRQCTVENHLTKNEPTGEPRGGGDDCCVWKFEHPGCVRGPVVSHWSVSTELTHAQQTDPMEDMDMLDKGGSRDGNGGHRNSPPHPVEHANASVSSRPLHPAASAYRYFRLYQCGRNSSGTFELCCEGIELFGRLIVA